MEGTPICLGAMSTQPDGTGEVFNGTARRGALDVQFPALLPSGMCYNRCAGQAEDGRSIFGDAEYSAQPTRRIRNSRSGKNVEDGLRLVSKAARLPLYGAQPMRLRLLRPLGGSRENAWMWALQHSPLFPTALPQSLSMGFGVVLSDSQRTPRTRKPSSNYIETFCEGLSRCVAHPRRTAQHIEQAF